MAQSSNKYFRFLKNLGIVFLGNVGVRVLNFAMIPFYTYYLAPSEYGISDLISTYSTMLLGLVTCQIQDSIFIFPKDQPHNQQARYFSQGLRFLLITYVTCGAFFALIALFFSGGGVFLNYIWMIFLCMLFSGFQSYIQQFVRSIDHMWLYAFSGVVFTVGSIIPALYLIPKFHNVEAFVASHYVGNVSSLVVTFCCAKLWRFCTWKSSFKNDLLPLLKYSIPLIPNTLMWWAIASLNRPFMEKHISLAAIGLYAVAIKIPGLIQVGWGIIQNAWQISVLEEYSRKSFAQYFNDFYDGLNCLFGLGIIFFTIFGRSLLGLVIAEQYMDACVLVPLLVLGALYYISAGVIGGVFSAAKASKYFLYSALSSIAITIVLNLTLIPAFGLLGAALANTGALLLELLVRICFVRKLTQFNHIFLKMIIFLCPTASVAVFYFVSSSIFKYSFWSGAALVLLGLLSVKLLPVVKKLASFKKARA